MKRMTLAFLIVYSSAFIACTNSSNKKNQMNETMQMDSSQNLPDSALKHTSRSLSNIDPKIDSSMSSIVTNYLQLKNALIADDGGAAAKAGQSLSDEIGKLDKTVFNPEQKKIYESIADDLKENADHIAESRKDIDHQREHFSTLSEDVYDLAKAFGSGRILYVDNCPKANDKKGSLWLSEFKEIKNPYYAGKMNNCVKIEEVMK